MFELLVDGKFLTTFSFLFGAGIARQWRRAEEQERDPTPFHLRRMAFLAAVGLAHAGLLRNGDVLVPYAFLGLALLVARRWTTRRVLWMAVALALVPYAVQGTLSVTGRTSRLAEAASGADLYGGARQGSRSSKCPAVPIRSSCATARRSRTRKATPRTCRRPAAVRWTN